MRASPYDILFEPVRIGPVTAKNRFYAVPHATGHGHLQPNGSIGVRETKAEGGWGVVAMQISEIAPDTDFAAHPMERIWDETDIPAHARLVERVKRHGALAAIELGHGGMRVRNFTSGTLISGPSHLPALRAEIPAQARAMDLSDIRDLRASHKRAAQRALHAGYDIVYVYAAHDLSILSHFLSRRTNARSDGYGGSFANRVRLLREVLEDTREVCAGRAGVALRFSVHEFAAEPALTHDGEGREVVAILAELPDLWDVNISGWSRDSSTSRFAEEGFQEPFISFVKSVTTKPVVGVGRYTSPDRMVSLVRKGMLDFIGAARPSIADPFLPRKIEEGRIDDIRECIGCNVCVASDSYGVPIRCTQNPTIGEEWRRGWRPDTITSIARKQSVLVVGAGPAGLDCALTLGRAGLDVTLADASDALGGRVTKECALPGLSAWSRVRDYRTYQIGKLANVQLYRESRMTAVEAEGFGADHIVIATGSHWRRDGIGSTRFQPLGGLENLQVLTPDDIMAGAGASKSAIVYDDEHNYMGGVIAEHLARQGCRTTLVTPHALVSAWTDYSLEQARIVGRLHGLGVEMRTSTTLQSIEAGKLVLQSATTGADLDAFEADALVLVTARLPNDQLYLDLKARGWGPDRLTLIGDALSPGLIQAAVLSGHTAARRIAGGDDTFKRERPMLLD